MKRIIVIALSLLCIVSCAKQSDFDALKGRVDSLESDKISTIEQQITSINNTIVSLLQADSKLLEQISDLKEMDSELARELTEKEQALSKRIDELKTYVDTQIKDCRSWASGTFSTLEQYQQTCDSLATIRQSITSLKTELTQAISSAITASETSMKSWVNEQLTGYWTIAETQAKLDALKKAQEDGDEDLAEDIAELQTALETAKTNITAAYEQAISDAITSNNGIINAKIASEIQTATQALNSRITSLENRMSNIESRLSELEDKVNNLLDNAIKSIQSIHIIPEVVGGGIFMPVGRTARVNFEIFPYSAAEAIASVGETALSMSAVYTSTKSSVRFIDIPILSESYSNGFFSIVVDGYNLSEEFYNGQIGASARLLVSGSTDTYSSDYFDIVKKDGGCVDLGLSVKWAECNIGANKPEEYGDYYAWGETNTKNTYDWSTYKFCKGSASTITKYCTSSSWGTVDNKMVLDDDDDVAHVEWGRTWRMATDAEWAELRNTDNCTWTWTTLNGVNGYIVQSRKDGYTDKSIFLPASGHYNGVNLDDVGSYGWYWSSSLESDRPIVTCLMFFSSSYFGKGSTAGRCQGLTVRPVSE